MKVEQVLFDVVVGVGVGVGEGVGEGVGVETFETWQKIFWLALVLLSVQPFG